MALIASSVIFWNQTKQQEIERAELNGSGCWFFATPLKNMSSSVGMTKFPIYGKIKLMFQTTIIFFRKSFDLTLDNSKTESLLILFIKSASHSIHACYHHFGWAITMCYMLNHGILLWTKRAGQRVKLGSPLNSDVFRGSISLRWGPGNMCFTQSRFCHVYFSVLSHTH